MANLVPFEAASLLPSQSSDRQLRKALGEIERRAALIECAAERKMQLTSSLNHTAKVQVAAAFAFSRQLKEIAPEAASVFDAFDLDTAEDLRATKHKASR